MTKKDLVIYDFVFFDSSPDRVFTAIDGVLRTNNPRDYWNSEKANFWFGPEIGKFKWADEAIEIFKQVSHFYKAQYGMKVDSRLSFIRDKKLSRDESQTLEFFRSGELRMFQNHEDTLKTKQDDFTIYMFDHDL